MKKTLLFNSFNAILMLFLVFSGITESRGQSVVQIGTGTDTSASTLYSPVYRFSNSSTTTQVKSNILFTQAEMAAVGILPGSTITSVEFNKTDTGSFLIPATFAMFMANTSNSTLATTTTWASIQASHTQVFSSTSFNVPTAAGWVSWNVTPFVYTGDGFEIATELSMTGGASGATNKFPWQFTSGNADKIIAVVGTGTTLNAATAAYKHRPNIKITFTPPSPCTDPPTAGSVIFSGDLCYGSSLVFSLSGNTSGSGQTIQWQESATGAVGTWTDISGANTNLLSISNSGSNWYRAYINCGTGSDTATAAQITMPPQLSGSYTIDASMAVSTTNYHSITDFVDDLNCIGISGPVTVSIAGATYSTSETFPIIFKNFYNLNNDSVSFVPSGTDTVIIEGSASSLFQFDGAANIVFDGGNGRRISLINNQSTANTSVLKLNSITGIGGTSNITIRNTEITGGSNTVITSYGIHIGGTAVTSSSTGEGHANFLFENNHFKRAYFAIYGSGTSASKLSGITIIDNIIGDDIHRVNFRGVDLSQTNGFTIARNKIYNFQLTTSVNIRGIEIGTGGENGLIDANLIHDLDRRHTAGFNNGQGIVLNPGALAANITVSNNVIYNLWGRVGTTITNNVWGIMVQTGSNINLYHNSINLTGTNAANTATTASLLGGILVNSAASASLDIRNNAISVSIDPNQGSATVYAIRSVAPSTAYSNIDYNIYHASGTQHFLGFLSADISTLTDWQTATGSDVNSLASDPIFRTNEDLRPGGGSPMIGSGTPLTAVTEDFEGNVRSTTAPYIGAFEVMPPPFDAAVLQIISPTSGCFLTSSEIISVEVANHGTVNLQEMPLAYQINGGAIIRDTLTQVLSPGDTVIFNFSVTADLSIASPIEILIFSEYPGDQNKLNDTLQVTLVQRLAGNYTIGATGADYTTISAAVNDLINTGVCGPVVFEFIDALYSTAETFPIEISQFVNPNNDTVIFRPALNVNTVIEGSANSTFRLSATSNIVFDGSNNGTGSRNLTIINNSTATNSAVIWLSSLGVDQGVTNTTIMNTHIIAGSNTVTTSYGISITGTAITTAGTGASHGNILITNNKFERAYFAILGNGTATSKINNLVITKNSIGSDDPANYVTFRGIAVTQATNGVFSNNHIYNFHFQPTGIMRGIELGSGVQNSLVDANLIHDFSKVGTTVFNSGQGIVINPGAGAANITVSNNVIHSLTGRSSTTITNNVWGILIQTGSNINIYHNSISLHGVNETTTSANTNAGGILINAVASNNLDIRNNAISISLDPSQATANVFGIRSAAVATNFTALDYNLYHMSGPQHYVGFLGSTHTTLADWRLATSMETNSLDSDPIFYSNTNLLPIGNSPLVNAGTPIASVTTDFLGNIRSTTAPFIGAYEVMPLQNDVAILSLLSPTQHECSGDIDVVAVFRNLGSNNLSNVPIQGTVSGASTASFSGTITSLNAGQIDTVVIGSISISSAGVINVEVYADLANDQQRSNDTLNTVTVVTLSVSAPQVTNSIIICEGEEAELIATHTTGRRLWFADANSFHVLHFDDTLRVSPLVSTDYYVMNVNPLGSFNVGPIDTSIGDASSALFNNNMYFDAYTDITIDSVKLIVDLPGTVEVTLLDNNDNVLDVTQVDALGGTHFVDLNFYIPAGNNYSLSVTGGTAVLYRNTTGAVYPYTVPGVMAITGTLNFVDRYYHLFDWHITSHAICASKREQVSVTVNPTPVVDLGPDISFCEGDSFQLDAGAGFASYTWSDNSTNQTLSVSTSGIYYVEVETSFGCQAFDTIEVTVHTLPMVNVGPDTSICIGEFLVLDAGISGNYTYLWSDNSTTQGIIVSTGGVYYVEVTDVNSCVNSDTMTLTINALPVVDLGNDTLLCEGNQLMLDAGSGYTAYTWNDNSQNQTLIVSTTGIYYVEVEDVNGCIGSDTIEVTFIPLPIISLGNDTAICVGESIVFDAGAGFSTYLWSDNSDSQTLVANTAGVYFVEVTNADGCIGVDSITLTINPLPIVNLGNDTTFCDGNSIILDAGAGQAFYQWNDNSNAQTLTVNASGVYSVQVTSNDGCTANDEITITVLPLPLATFTSNEDWGGKVTFVADEPNGIAYNWDFGDGTTGVGSTVVHTYTMNNTYNVELEVTGANNCINVNSVQVSVLRVSVELPKTNSFNLNVYPNPFNDNATIEFTLSKGGDVLIEVYDLLGRRMAVLKDGYAIEGTHALQFGDIENKNAAGKYIVRMVYDNTVVTRQIIKLNR